MATIDKNGVLPPAPARKLVVITCMDARLDLGRALGITLGDAHILRNAGGVVTEDVLRSLVISQRLLGTEEIALVHHTDCGALKFRDDTLKDQIERETGVRPGFALEAFTDLERDVRQSAARIRACPFLLHTDRIRGYVYDVETHSVREVDGLPSAALRPIHREAPPATA